MLNKTILQGRFISDPEFKTIPSGAAVCNFRIAWSEKYKDTETQCFLNCVAWRNTAEFVNKYFSKGQECIVEGKLVTRNYEDKDGHKRTQTELVVDTVHFCGKKESGATANTTSYAPSVGTNTPDFEELDFDLESDLPF